MKIRLVHLLSLPHEKREIISQESIFSLNGRLNIEYVKVVNKPYHGKVPRNCIDNRILVNFVPATNGAKLLGPTHYGCWKAHRDAVFDFFDKDLDYFMICECDCFLNVSLQMFDIILEDVCRVMKEHSLSYLTFGGLVWRSLGSPNVYKIGHDKFRYTESFRVLEKLSDYVCLVNYFLCTHFIMFPQQVRKSLINSFKNSKWDSIDQFYNMLFSASNNRNLKGYKIGSTSFPVAKQIAAYSLLNREKKYKWRVYPTLI